MRALIMVDRVKRLQKIIELAEMEMDQAAQTMDYMRNKLATDESQLYSLKDYQHECAQKPAQSGVINPIQLQAHNAFNDKLVQAISAQENVVAESQKMQQLAEQAWHEKRARVKALQAMQNRLKAKHEARLSKQEQKLLDELSAQKFIQNQSK